MTMFHLDIPLDTQHICQMQALYNFPGMILYMQYINTESPVIGNPNLRQNHEAERELMGQALVRHALHRVVRPEALTAHVRTLLFNVDLAVSPNSPCAIVCADQVLRLRIKAPSTTCKRTYLVINMNKRHQFWHFNYPHGRDDVSTRDMLDMDQAGMKLEGSNKKFGKTVLWE